MKQTGRTLWVATTGIVGSLADDATSITRLLTAVTSVVRELWPIASGSVRWLRPAPAAVPAVPYETLVLDLSLVLADPRGERAVLTRRQRVRFLGPTPTSIRETIWGEGEQLVRYQVRGARKLAVRPEGSKRAVLLEPARPVGVGETYTITSRRTIRGGFAGAEEYCEAALERPTQHLRFSILFPQSRPPRAAWLVLAAREQILRWVPIRYDAQGRARLRCSVQRPLVAVTYSLRWSW